MVETIIFKIDQQNPDEKTVKKTADVIKKGGLVIYPTETCYGIGADATNEKAVAKLREIKDRSGMKPISIIVSDMQMMKKYGVITKEVMTLVKKFMPGPLTIVINKKNTVPKILNPKEIAFRIPSNKIAIMLTKLSKVPITAPSANPEGFEPAYDAKKAAEYFDGKVDLILDAGRLKKIKPSTIVDMKTKEPIVVRQGPISFSKIKAALK